MTLQQAAGCWVLGGGGKVGRVGRVGRVVVDTTAGCKHLQQQLLT